MYITSTHISISICKQKDVCICAHACRAVLGGPMFKVSGRGLQVLEFPLVLQSVKHNMEEASQTPGQIQKVDPP